MTSDQTNLDSLQDQRFASLLDQYHDARRSGVDSGFWRSNPVEPELRARVENAYATAAQLENFFSTTARDSVTTGTLPTTIRDLFAQPSSLDRFELLQELGRGGYGVVYLANDPLLNRQVAIKIPRLEILSDQGLRQRFVNEAKIAAALDHPGIVPVFEIGDSKEGIYIVSLYCPGQNLGQWLQENPGQLNLTQMVELVDSLASALEHCHANKVLHRDLKPANILLFPSPFRSLPFTPRLTDFGLAKLMENSFRETGSSMLLGTPLYMAPEQAWSRLDEIGPGTDVYAVGVILYELLTGAPPFEAKSLAVMLDEVRSKLPPAMRRGGTDIPADLETICLKCLQKEPSDRYLSVGELRADLSRYLQGQAIAARKPSYTQLILRWAKQPARLQESSLVITFINVVFIGTLIFAMILAWFKLIPSSTPTGLPQILLCTSILLSLHVPLIYAGLKIRSGSQNAIRVCFVVGILMMLAAACFMLGFPSSDEFYWHDMPGFRVVYGAFFMLATLQTVVSGIAALARQTRTT